MKTPLNKAEILALSVTKAIGSIWSVIIHTLFFIGAFVLILLGVDFDRVLLVLTTVVSLEAIYLSIFIQMSVNYQGRALASVEKEIDEIAEDVEDIQENVEEMQEDVEGIAEDVEEIAEDVEDIAEDVEDIAEDVEEMQEDIDEMQTVAEEVDQKIDQGQL
jgi:uncharacterized protein YoxC